MFNRARKQKVQAAETQPAPTRRLFDERDVLRSRSAEVTKAEQAIADMAANVLRLETIISDAAEAETALQVAVAEDAGVSLAAFANGEAAPDSEITTRLANAENTARAAVAARVALPRAQANLLNAQEQITHLETQRQQAIRDFLLMLAAEPAREYVATWNKFCSLHDTLVGISNALPSAASTENDLRMTTTPIVAPRFNLAPIAHSSEFLATMEHFANDHAVQDVAGKWLAGRDRLSNDVEADVFDLLEDAA
jgi:hypothetical protein